MRHDGYIERWDELAMAMELDETIHNRGTGRMARAFGPGTVAQFWHIVELSFREHQTWFRKSLQSDRILVFPYAMFLKPGMKIINRTKNVQYQVVSVIQVEMDLPSDSGVVTYPAVVIANTSPLPEHSDRLQFEEEYYIALRSAWTRSPAEHLRPEDYQREETGSFRECITYTLVQRGPGSTSGPPFGRQRDRRHRFREELFEQHDATEVQMVYGQVMDNLSHFDCWAPDPVRADRLADYFEQFMILWSPVIAYNGPQRILFWSRGDDAIDQRMPGGVVSRSLRYFFRTEDIKLLTTSLIRAVNVNVRITADLTELNAATGIPGTGDPLTGVLRFEILE